MLLNEKNVLRHKDLHISGLLNVKKADIHAEKVDIEGMLSEKKEEFSPSKQPCMFVNDCI